MGIIDDFDWDDMAMAGSLAEEMAEEAREQRRLERGVDEDDYGDRFDASSVIRPSRRHRISRETPPYLKYTNDRLQKKRLERELLQRCKGSLEAFRAAATETDLMGVKIRNSHLVSDKLFYFLYQVLFCHPQARVRAITFTQGGTPVVNGREEFGIFDADTWAITINLRKHFENAARVLEMAPTGFSLRGLVWTTTAMTFMHEYKHALDTAGATPAAGASRDEQEAIADQWAAEAVTSFARKTLLEPPPLAEDPYFGPLITRYVEQSAAAGAAWAGDQKVMLARGLFYRNAAAAMEVATVREYHELSLSGQDGDEAGQRLNECILMEQSMLQKAFELEERCEQALRDTIAKNGKVRVVHRAAGSEKSSAAIAPEMLLKRGPFVWVKASDIETGQAVEIRIDRIEEFEHLH